MKVKELIAQLGVLDLEQEVFVYCEDPELTPPSHNSRLLALIEISIEDAV